MVSSGVSTVQKLPILSILIPTFQRAYLLKNTLYRFVESIQAADLPPGMVEILVSDNQSTDSTEGVVSSFSEHYPFIRYYKQPVHYSSGEENLFTAMPECCGTYVWTFSDDDIPERSSVRTILEILGRRPVDLILINPALISPEGKILREQHIECDCDEMEMSPQTLIATLGMINLSCCFSAVIYNRQRFMNVDWQKYIKASPIYSHVIIYCEAFNGGRALFVSKPLIQYRVGGTESDAWLSRSRLLKLPQRFPWSIGLIRLLKLARSRGAIPSDFLHRITERDLQGPFLLNEYILWELTVQIIIWMDGKVAYEAVTAEHIEEYLEEFASGDQHYVEMLYKLKKVQTIWEAVAKQPTGSGDFVPTGSVETFLHRLPDATHDAVIAIVRRWAMRMIHEVRSLLNARSAVKELGTYHGYNLFRFTTQFIAIDQTMDAVDVTRVDFAEWLPGIVIRSSLGELRAEIDRLSHSSMLPAKDATIPAAGYKIYKRNDGFVAVRAGETSAVTSAVGLWKHYPRLVGHPAERTVAAYVKAIEDQEIKLATPFEGLIAVADNIAPQDLQPYFDESWYLRRYADVAAAVRNDVYKTGFDHFLSEGMRAGLDPGPFFHQASALIMYPNVAAAIEAKLYWSWLDFYVRCGRFLGFSPSTYFDEALYRALYGDVRDAIGGGALVCALEHYLRYGLTERRIPTMFFDGEWYAAQRSDAGLGASHATSPYLHYLTVGEGSGADPNPWFSNETYLSLNPDVAHEIKSGRFRSGFHHWASIGARQRRRLA